MVSAVTHQRYILGILLAELVVFTLSGVGFSGLHGDVFFSLGVDPFQWLPYLFRIPQVIGQHQSAGYIMDALILITTGCLIRWPGKNKFAWLLLPLLWTYYAMLTGYLGHRNFQSGFVFIIIPFLFKTGEGRRLAWQGLRYYLLFFYFSAALLKIYHVQIFSGSHFSAILQTQMAPYFLEQHMGVRTAFNQYLVQHPPVSQGLFIGSIIIECLPFAGFFTRRYDTLIAIALLLFHAVNWLIMDIAPFGQLALICMLFFTGNIREREKHFNQTLPDNSYC